MTPSFHILNWWSVVTKMQPEDLYFKVDEHQLDEMDGLRLRFALAARMNKMRYGTVWPISGAMVMKAWPPTGDHDRSFESAFRALALSNGGHRPETSYTSEERIRNDLDETFSVHHDVLTGDWSVERMAHCCPRCRGSKKRFEREPMKLPVSVADFSADVSEKIAGKWVECDCLPVD